MNNTQNVIALFDKHAKGYQEKYMNVDLYGDSLDLFCAQLEKQNAEVLELACGPGNITRYLLNKRPDLKILATDLAPSMLELAKINNPEASFQLLDCREVNTLGKKWDAVMCGFCLPYLSKEDAIQFIQDAANALNDKGLLYISTMEDDYSKSGIQYSSTGDELYMYFHQADYLTEALENNGFKLLDLRRKVYSMQEGVVTTDLILLAIR
jgi:ubiquinone/menaquinone biosynthesis C-methylase UbiE